MDNNNEIFFLKNRRYYSRVISQRNWTFDSRYKFTAKELDNETNYTYFGASYYDSDVSIWLSACPP
jgi:hypothetical protein